MTGQTDGRKDGRTDTHPLRRRFYRILCGKCQNNSRREFRIFARYVCVKLLVNCYTVGVMPPVPSPPRLRRRPSSSGIRIVLLDAEGGIETSHNRAPLLFLLLSARKAPHPRGNSVSHRSASIKRRGDPTSTMRSVDVICRWPPTKRSINGRTADAPSRIADPSPPPRSARITPRVGAATRKTNERGQVIAYAYRHPRGGILGDFGPTF